MEKSNMLQEAENTKRHFSARRYILAAGFILLLVTSALVIVVLTQVSKPDAASEAIIREAAAAQLDKDPNELTDDDFAKITELSIGEKTQTIISMYDSGGSIEYAYNRLSDIRLLRKFTNLQILYLGSVSVPEQKIPKWMKFLTKHGLYNLDKRLSIDLSPLKKLHSLETLQLGGPAIVDIRPLAGLNLKNLQLISASIPDLRPIKSLTQLEKLYIIFCAKIKYDDIEDLHKAIPNLKVTTTINPPAR